jgi:hypothetical protein
MTRALKLVALTGVLTLALAGVALAALTKVTGGTTTLTASDAAAKVLADNHITVTPVAPATASGTTFTFPITGGRLNTKTLHGVIRDGGGVSVSNGTKTVTLRRPTIISDKRGVTVWALLRGKAVHVCRHVGRHHAKVHCLIIARLRSVRIARVTDVKVSGGTATGTAKITEFTAQLINRLAGKHVVAAGDVLGTASVTPTLK